MNAELQDQKDEERRRPEAPAPPVVPVGPAISLFGDTPKLAYERMVEIADVFKSAVNDHPQFVSTLTFNEGKRNERRQSHVTIEGWVFMGNLAGLYARTRWVEFVTGKFETEEWQGPQGQRRKVAKTLESNGYRAFAEAVTLAGSVVGAHEGLCLAMESRWGGGTDEYARKSMAQTRAKSQALATVLRPLAEMAGFKGTPEEEVRPVVEREAAEERKKEGTAERPIFQSWKDLLTAVDSISGAGDGFPTAKEWLAAAALATDGIEVKKPTDLGERKADYFEKIHRVFWAIQEANEGTEPFLTKEQINAAWLSQFPKLGPKEETEGDSEGDSAANQDEPVDPEAKPDGDSSANRVEGEDDSIPFGDDPGMEYGG